MTLIASTADKQHRGRDRQQSIIVLIIIMIGLGIFLYPSAADWFSRLNHNNAITEYRESALEITDEVRSEALLMADEYNSRMPQGPLRDPYAWRSADADTDPGYAEYEQLLNISESGVIGRVKYDGVGIDLPIYHGTGDEVIAKGAGHLFGSSLPVGGPSTHSVLTAHSGLPAARLFTGLHDSEIGDEFWVEVLGERHWYRVENIVVAEPNDLSTMHIIEGKDYVTLFTCTPIGVNSHRIMVRGERIEAPPPAVDQMQGEVQAGFPWWILIFISGSGAAALLLYVRNSREPLKPVKSVDPTEPTEPLEPQAMKTD